MSQIKQEMDNAINKEQEDVRKLIFEGRELNNKGEYTNAIQKFAQAKEIIDIPLCSYYLGVAYYKKGDYEKASEYLDRTIHLYQEQKPSRVFLESTYSYKMHIAYHRNAYDEALKNCEKAIFYADGSNKKILNGMRSILKKLVENSKKLTNPKKNV